MTTFATRSPAPVRAVIALILCALLLAACGRQSASPEIVVAEGAKAGDLSSLVKCPYEANGGKTTYEAECGTLVVPENRSEPNSRLIALPVIRIHALSHSPAEPIFFLQGGPGGSNIHFQFMAGLVDDHDFVQVGYRGVDGSVVLDCPEVADAVRNVSGELLSDASMDAYADAAARCAKRFDAEGVDLAGYTMTEVIADVESARTALGYERINLLGQSYGTRLEILYEQMHPEALKRVVMVAVNPPGHFLWEPADIDKQLEDYAALCANDAACSARTDDLMATLRRVNQNFPRRWLLFPIDESGVKMVSFISLMESSAAPWIPVPLNGPAMIDLWLDAAEGDASGMALITMARNRFIPELFVYGDLLAKGNSAGDFTKHASDYRTSLNPPDSVLGSPLSLYHAALGAGWQSHLIPEEYLSLQPTDVETLLVSGSIDFSTAPQFANEELLPYLSNGRQVILKDFGHTETFWNKQAVARTHLLTTFFRTGEVDDSRYLYEAVDFQPVQTWGGMAKAALAIVLGIIALLAALAWFVIRLVRRRRTSSSAVHEQLKTGDMNHENNSPFDRARVPGRPAALGLWREGACAFGSSHRRAGRRPGGAEGLRKPILG